MKDRLAEWPCLFLAVLDLELHHHSPPASALDPYIEAAGPLESHLIRIDPGVE